MHRLALEGHMQSLLTQPPGRTREGCCLHFTITHGNAPPHSSSESYPQVMIQNKNTIKKTRIVLVMDCKTGSGLAMWIQAKESSKMLGFIITLCCVSPSQEAEREVSGYLLVFPHPQTSQHPELSGRVCFLHCGWQVIFTKTEDEMVGWHHRLSGHEFE